MRMMDRGWKSFEVHVRKTLHGDKWTRSMGSQRVGHDLAAAAADNHLSFEFLSLGDGFDYHLLYNVMNLNP